MMKALAQNAFKSKSLKSTPYLRPDSNRPRSNMSLSRDEEIILHATRVEPEHIQEKILTHRNQILKTSQDLSEVAPQTSKEKPSPTRAMERQL